MPKTAILIDALGGLQCDPQAARSFELMSGAFIWSDERPAGYSDIDADFAFRFLVAYRASLVRGAPQEQLRFAWDAVLAACPEWPGFRPERRSADLAADLDRDSRRTSRRVDALDRLYRRKQV